MSVVLYNPKPVEACYCGSGKRFRDCCSPRQKQAMQAPSNLHSLDALVDYALANYHYEHQYQLASQLYMSKEYLLAMKLGKKVLEKRPQHVNVIFMLACILHDTGNLETAEEMFRSTLRLREQFLYAYFMLIQIYLRQERFMDALKTGIVAKHFFNDDTPMDIRANLTATVGQIVALSEPTTALKIIEESLREYPDDPDLHMTYATTLIQAGKMREAIETAKEVAAKFNIFYAKVFAALAVPYISKSIEEIQTIRHEMESSLATLIQDGRIISEPRNTKWNTFYLAYHGLNNRPLLEKVCQFFRKVSPIVNYTAPHCRPGAIRKPGNIRVGFISRYFREHSVSNIYGEMIKEWAQKPDLDCYILNFGSYRDERLNEMHDNIKGRLGLPQELDEMQQTVASLQLDILVYLDIGLSQESYFLAMARLAPVQCVMAGHPDTTGIDTMDYYLTNRYIEPENCQEHYTETPVLFEHMVANVKQASWPEMNKSKEELGLPTEGKIYLCPGMLQKYHPDFDRALLGILKKDPQGHAVFFDDNFFSRKEELQERLQKNLGEYYGRVHFMKWAEGDDFKRYIAYADAVLETFHFGSGNTAMLAISLDQPMVIWPGEFMRGRTVKSVYDMAGIQGPVAATQEEFVDVAIRMANDETYRNRMKEEIRTKKHKLFGRTAATDEIYDWFRMVAVEHQPTRLAVNS